MNIHFLESGCLWLFFREIIKIFLFILRQLSDNFVWSDFQGFNHLSLFDLAIKIFLIVLNLLIIDLSDIKINIFFCIWMGIFLVDCFLHLQFQETWYFHRLHRIINFLHLRLFPSWLRHFRSKDFQSTIRLLRKLFRKIILWKFWKLLYVSSFIMIRMSELWKGWGIGSFWLGRGFHDVFKWKYWQNLRYLWS